MIVASGTMLVIQSLVRRPGGRDAPAGQATPGGVPSYLVSKLVTTSLTVGVYLLLVAIPGSFLVDGLNTGSSRAWLTIAWVVGLGMIATQLLGAVLGSLVASPRAASYVALLVMALITVSRHLLSIDGAARVAAMGGAGYADLPAGAGDAFRVAARRRGGR